MAKLQRNTLKGDFAELSMFFLKDNGFHNVETCSNKSVWVGNGIQIELNQTDIVNYKKLFTLIYDSGVSYGKYIERKQLVDGISQFILNYDKQETPIADGCYSGRLDENGKRYYGR